MTDNKSKLVIVCITSTFEPQAEYITSVRKMCADRGIYFCHRIYDAKNFREDRKYVTHLPAYHIMQNKENITTIYPEQNIPELLDFYIEKMKTRKSMLEIIFKKFKRKSPLASYI